MREGSPQLSLTPIAPVQEFVRGFRAGKREQVVAALEEQAHQARERAHMGGDMVVHNKLQYEGDAQGDSGLNSSSSMPEGKPEAR